jgi:hypothetical protein
MLRPAAAMLVLATLAACAGSPAGSAAVTIDGTHVPRAISMLDLTIDVGEFREGGAPDLVHLIPTAKRYGVCIVARDPVAVLDAVFPASAAAARFEVTVEDGRSFSKCLARSLKGEGEGRNRRLTYCLRCEDVTTP